MIAIRLLLLSCVIIWGWTFVATRICLGYMSPMELIGLRFTIGLPILLAVVLFKKISLGSFRANGKQLALGSGLITAHFIIQATALRTTSATNTGWIIAVTPLVMAALAFVVLREPIGREAWVGIIVATLGILVLVSKGHLSSMSWLKSWGDWLILLSAHTWALYTISTRDLSRSRHPLAVTLLVFTPLTVVCLTTMAVTSHLSTFVSLPMKPVLAMLFLGVLGTAAQWFWQEGVARLGAAKAGIFLYLEPLATTALAVPLLGESYGWSTAFGGFMVLAGVWWAERRPGRRPVVRARQALDGGTSLEERGR